MSLREEIIQSIKDNVDNLAWNETTEICADDIISLIEKRIDELLKQVEAKGEETMTRDNITCWECQIDIIEKVKEMLKK